MAVESMVRQPSFSVVAASTICPSSVIARSTVVNIKAEMHRSLGRNIKRQRFAFDE